LFNTVSDSASLVLNEQDNAVIREFTNSRGQIVVLMKFVNNDPVYDDLNYLEYLAAILLIGSILAIALFFLLIHRWITVPLRRINKSLSEGEIEPVRYLLEKEHAFGEIARLIRRYKEQTADLIAEVRERTTAEEKVRAILETNFHAVAIVEQDSRVSMINDVFVRETGYSKEEVIGSKWINFVPESDRERMLEYNRKRLIDPSSAPTTYEFSFYTKNGMVRSGTITVAIIRTTGQLVVSFNLKPE
jgi:PAS domain S-box-containing protein